jgi:hypothetical protein
MGRTACTEPQCLYKGDLYLYLYYHHQSPPLIIAFSQLNPIHSLEAYKHCSTMSSNNILPLQRGIPECHPLYFSTKFLRTILIESSSTFAILSPWNIHCNYKLWNYLFYSFPSRSHYSCLHYHVLSPFLKLETTWERVEIRDNALCLKSLHFHLKTCHNPGYNLMAWPVKSQLTQDHTLI